MHISTTIIGGTIRKYKTDVHKNITAVPTYVDHIVSIYINSENDSGTMFQAS